MYSLKNQALQIFPSFILIGMGLLDCLTTVMGVLYYGASEANPVLMGIVSTNIVGFAAIKIVATVFIAFSYLLAKKMLSQSVNKQTISFKFSRQFIRVSYVGLIAFLSVVVVNNLLVLFG